MEDFYIPLKFTAKNQQALHILSEIIFYSLSFKTIFSKYLAILQVLNKSLNYALSKKTNKNKQKTLGGKKGLRRSIVIKEKKKRDFKTFWYKMHYCVTL